MNHQISLRLKQAKEFIQNQKGGQIAPMLISEEESNPQIQDDLSYQARPLESMTHCYRVGFDFPEDSLCSEFSFFEDGKQKTINIGHITTTINQRVVIIPVHFFAVGAVILRRTDDRELKVWGEPQIVTGILVAKSLVPDQNLLDEFEANGLRVVDTEVIGGDYSNLRMRALQKAKDLRLGVETDLIAVWRKTPEAETDLLVVDGTLMNFRNEDNVEKCVGVSKSFGTRYFEISDHNRIMQMNEFERSWAFVFHDEGEDQRLGARERISWYLRLRNRQYSEPEFGLIRVEISKRHTKQASEYVERISRSLLSERFPTAYPAPRWDKHLYPIQACENYLTSVMPSTATIFASMKG